MSTKIQRKGEYMKQNILIFISVQNNQIFEISFFVIYSDGHSIAQEEDKS